METAPELVQRMVEDGHTVGNHTYHHPDMSAISTIEDFQKEVDDVADLFHEITGTELSKYYRAPQGKCNESNLAMAQQLGYATFFGVLPMWIGTRSTNPAAAMHWTSLQSAFTLAQSYFCITLPRQMGKFWMNY